MFSMLCFKSLYNVHSRKRKRWEHFESGCKGRMPRQIACCVPGLLDAARWWFRREMYAHNLRFAKIQRHQKYRNTKTKNTEIQIQKVQKCCRSRGQCMHTICALQKYKDQKYTNTNTKNTEMQIQKVQKCCWSRGKSMHAICALHKYKEKNAELQRQIIEKYKYKKSKNAADPGGKCMHTICALQPIRPTTTSGTPKQLTKCENPLAKHWISLCLYCFALQGRSSAKVDLVWSVSTF